MSIAGLPRSGAEPFAISRGPLGAAAHRASGIARFARRKPLGAFGAALVLVFLVMALVAPSIVPHNPRETVAPPLQAPSRAHLLGTDANGFDVLSRVVVGSQISLAVGFAVVVINVAFSTVLGMAAGYYQRVIDYVIQRSGEVWSAFPGLIALLLIRSILGPPETDGGNLLTIAWDFRNLIFAFSIGAIFGGSRIVRGVTLQLKTSDYVIAARSLGATDTRIIARHILPNVFPYVIIGATMGLGGVILGEAALSFLGLGPAPGTPSWGMDISGRNRTYAIYAPWLVIAPGVAISLTVLGFNLFGDALRDILDPRLRGSR
jgi:peptide/nickel transport system permease protein